MGTPTVAKLSNGKKPETRKNVATLSLLVGHLFTHLCNTAHSFGRLELQDTGSGEPFSLVVGNFNEVSSDLRRGWGCTAISGPSIALSSSEIERGPAGAKYGWLTQRCFAKEEGEKVI
jgi:hypothetical protein